MEGLERERGRDQNPDFFIPRELIYAESVTSLDYIIIKNVECLLI